MLPELPAAPLYATLSTFPFSEVFLATEGSNLLAESVFFVPQQTTGALSMVATAAHGDELVEAGDVAQFVNTTAFVSVPASLEKWWVAAAGDVVELLTAT